MNPPKILEFDLQETIHKNRLISLWKLMRGFRLHYLGATIALGVSAISKTGMFLLVQFLVDDVLGNNLGYLLPWVALGFVGLALLEGAFTFTSGRLAARTAEGISYRLRNYIFDHIQRLTFTYHDNMQTGELLQRATSDVDAINRFFLQQATEVGRILLLFTVNFIAISRINTQLALISVIAIPILWVMSWYFFGKIEKSYSALQEQEAVLSTTLQENLSGVRVVKAFARQPYEIEKFDRESRSKYNKGIRVLLIHSLFWPITDVIAAAQMIGGFYTGAMLAINGLITTGDYLAYAGMVIWIIWPMRNLGRLIVQGSTALVSYNRIMEIIKQNREPMETGLTPEHPVKGRVVFENVHFAYDKENRVLNNILFETSPGERVALMGSTGSGKTSVVNLLPRFYDYFRGRILIDGTEITELSRKYIRSQIGIVEQEPFLFSRSIRENIAYGAGRDVTDEEVYAAAKSAAIHDVVESFPQGYDTIVGERGVTLSGGQKQRIAIARALLKNPRILILDDATSSVDTETEAQIREALEHLMEGRTTFIIAHRIQSVMHADQIIVFDKGYIVQQGSHDDLLKDKTGLYRRIYDVQSRIEEEMELDIQSVSTD